MSEDILYYEALDSELKLELISQSDYETTEEFLEAKANARVERDLSWMAYEDSLLSVGVEFCD